MEDPTRPTPAWQSTLTPLTPAGGGGGGGRGPGAPGGAGRPPHPPPRPPAPPPPPPPPRAGGGGTLTGGTLQGRQASQTGAAAAAEHRGCAVPSTRPAVRGRVRGRAGPEPGGCGAAPTRVSQVGMHVAEEGVHALSHRNAAQDAGVPSRAADTSG
jgi:hypothetical protein